MGAGALAWGYYPAGKEWKPLRVDIDGSIHVVGYVDELDDIGDVDVAAPTDGYVLYWDDFAGKFKLKAFPPSKIVDADGDTSWDVEQAADEDIVRGKVAGVEAFHMSAAGIVTLARQPSVKAYLDAATQAILTGTETKVNLEAEVWDRQNEFDVTTHKYTATEAGDYLCIGQAQWPSPTNGKRYSTHIYKNGASVAVTSFHSGSGETLNSLTVTTIALAAGDFLELWVWHNAGVNKDIRGAHEARTLLVVYKVG